MTNYGDSISGSMVVNVGMINGMIFGMIMGYTLWYKNIAMEMATMTWDFPVKMVDPSIVTFNYQRVCRAETKLACLFPSIPTNVSTYVVYRTCSNSILSIV